MRRFRALAIFVSICALVQAAPAPEGFTIKLKEPGNGDVVVVDRTDKTTNKIKIVDGQGRVLYEVNQVITEIQEYKETIGKRDGKKIVKAEREYIKAELKDGEKADDVGLNGKTVVIEKKADKYTFLFKGGEAVTGKALSLIAKDFKDKVLGDTEMEQLMLPKGPVKPGDEWKLDMRLIIKTLNKQGEMEADEAKATGTGKLVKAHKKDGKDFGVMQYKLEIPIKAIGVGPMQMKYGDTGKITYDVLMDVCIDGSADARTMKMNMAMTGTANHPDLPGASVSVDVNLEGSKVHKEPAKK